MALWATAQCDWLQLPMSIWATCMSLMSNEESVLQLLWEGEGRVIEKERWESGDQNLILIHGLAVWLSLRGDRDDKLKLVAADTVCSLNIHLPREKTFGWVYCNAAWLYLHVWQISIYLNLTSDLEGVFSIKTKWSLESGVWVVWFSDPVCHTNVMHAVRAKQYEERIFTSEPEACLLHAEECVKKMPEFVEMVLEMENVKLEYQSEQDPSNCGEQRCEYNNCCCEVPSTGRILQEPIHP
ncbi:hypothetical protein Anapl_01423 [Anas platyrhynchos]|uniref:Uncharacterized protein n=1 Tax=Anas platyrhynchos TaxID=8839 RepID=R0LRW4_ANAPL|nr:hypothetical protein Anapl_01423 [Anas platyrhynchos]